MEIFIILFLSGICVVLLFIIFKMLRCQKRKTTEEEYVLLSLEDQGSSLIQSIGSNSLSLVSDLTEASLDSVLKDGLLKEVPIVGSLVNLFKIGIAVNDRFFFKKLLLFLQEAEKIDPEIRQKFLNEHYKNDKSGIDLGEKLIVTIDKVDSKKKSYYIAKAFRLFVLSSITDIEFYDLLYAIENFKLHYTQFFIDTCLTIEEYERVRPEIMDHFFVTGLFHQDREERNYIYNLGEKRYSNDRITPIGEIFLEEILEVDQQALKRGFIDKILRMSQMRFNPPYVQTHVLTTEEFEKFLSGFTIRQFLNMKFRGSMLKFFDGVTNEWIFITSGLNEGTFEFYQIK